MGDRALGSARFLGVSALFHVAIAPATYNLWRTYFSPHATHDGALPLWLWAAAIVYIAVPAALGSWIASAFLKEKGWATAIVGSTAAPTAWDAVFSAVPKGSAVLMKLKTGTWVGGEFADGSYVGGYPEPADIYLVNEYVVDQQTGDFMQGPDGDAIPVGTYGLLVRWEEIEYLEIGD